MSTSFGIIYPDVWGPSQPFVSGHTYISVLLMVSVVLHGFISLSARINDVFDIFMQFQCHVEDLLNNKIMHIQTG
jgi:hypothetical protein